MFSVTYQVWDENEQCWKGREKMFGNENRAKDMVKELKRNRHIKDVRFHDNTGE